MKTDRFAMQVENAIYNWYTGGSCSKQEPVYNALKIGMDEGMQVLVPVDMSDSLRILLNRYDGDEDYRDDGRHAIGLKRLENSSGDYYVPIFTSHQMLEDYDNHAEVMLDFKELVLALESWRRCSGFIINDETAEFIIDRGNLDLLLDYKPVSHIECIYGSVLDLCVDAVVCSVNEKLRPCSGTDRKIHRAAGVELEKCLRTYGSCDEGDAIITRACSLMSAYYIIHTVGLTYDGEKEAEDRLAECCSTALELAYRSNCMSVAFPCISAGNNALLSQRAGEIALSSTVKWLNEHPDTVMNIYFCCNRRNTLQEYNDMLAMLQS